MPAVAVEGARSTDQGGLAARDIFFHYEGDSMMKTMLKKLWVDDGGALIAVEWMFVATILVIGAIVGIVAVRNAVNAELTGMANAIGALNQCYSFSGQQNCAASTCGSQVTSCPSSQITTTSTCAQNAVNIVVNPCE
jgi:hypothetical protein